MRLSRLAEIDWASLDHSYGTAENVPSMLRDLVSPDPGVRAEAHSVLANCLNHQGNQRWDATAQAVPFLIGLVQDPATPDRHEILGLLTELAVGKADGAYVVSGFQIDDVCTPSGTKEFGRFVFWGAERRTPNDLEYGALLRAIYVAVAAGAPIYVALLEADDVLVRREAAHLLAFMTLDAAPVAEALAKRLACEDDATARGGCGLALSLVTRFTPPLHASCRARLEQAMLGAEDRVERALSAVALLSYDDPSELTRSTLIDALRAPPSVTRAECPWAANLFGLWLLRHLVARAPAAWRPEVVASACLYLREHENHDHRVLELCETLLEAHFVALPETAVASPEKETLVVGSELDELQRTILQTFVSTPRVWRFGNIKDELSRFGLPTEPAALSRLAEPSG